MARPHNHSHLSLLLLLLLRLLLLFPAATAASYASLCHSPAAARDDHSRGAPLPLPRISTGHFSGGGDLLFALGLRSFSFSPRHSSASATTDPAVTHLSATLTLEGTRRRGARPHSVSFDLDGYYSAAAATAELCMVGSGSYAREDGFGVVLLSDVVLRLRVPHPSNLSTPFVTGRLGGAHFNPISLVAYTDDDDYEFGNAASCPPPSPPAGGTRRHVLRPGVSRCGRLRALIGTRSPYSLEYRRPNGGGHAASGGFPLRLGHRVMYVNQMRCAANGAMRAYMVFYTNNNQPDAFPSSNYTGRWRRGRGFLVGDEALVADGFWDSSRGRLCLRACRVVRSGQSSADLAVGGCGIGVSLWFPAVWSIRDRSVAAGMIWNATGGGGGGMDGVISVSRTGGYAGNMSEIRYNYTLVKEAKKHYDSMPELSTGRKGRFPGNYSYADLSLYFSVKRKGFTGNGYASPFTIGSDFVQGGRLMSDDDAFHEAGEMSKQQRLLNVSYDVGYWLQHLDHTSRNFSQGDQRSFSAEGVYDTKAGSLCMVACEVMINASSDCEVLITFQFAPTDTMSRERAVGTIRSLRKQSDPLFFEPLDLVAEGMTAIQWAESSSRMDMESVMLVASMALSCAFTALQLRHVRKHPEALPAMSVTMLAVLALGYVVPLVLNLEDMYRDTRKQFFVKLTTGGSLELNEFMLRASTMLAFVLQLRLLQLALSRRSTDQDQAAGSKHGEEGPSPADAERSTLWICLPLYALGAVVVWIAHMNAPPGPAVVDNNLAAKAGPAVVDNLAAYAGLVLDGFLLPQVVWNAFSGAGARRAPALSPWFYAGGSVIRAAPHAYDAFRKQRYVPSWRPSYVYASPRDDLFGVGWDVAVPCGAAALAALVFLQQRLGGAFLCGLKSRRRAGGYEMASSVSS